jgi:hypothetical protein
MWLGHHRYLISAAQAVASFCTYVQAMPSLKQTKRRLRFKELAVKMNLPFRI